LLSHIDVTDACCVWIVPGAGVADWIPGFCNQPVDILDNWQHVADDVRSHNYSYQRRTVTVMKYTCRALPTVRTVFF